MYRVGIMLAALVMMASCLSCVTPKMAADSGKLHLAAQSGDRAGIDAALQSGSPVNQIDNYGKTPLIFATESGNIAIVEYLLNKGANPNHTADDGSTPLIIAVRKGNSRIAELLIQRGALINSIGDDGFTALTITAEKGSKNVFDVLLKLGAKPDVSIANRDTALMKSIPRKDSYYFDRLLESGADPNKRGRAGNTPLIIAACTNKLEIAEKLLKAGAHFNETNDSGNSALLFAAGLAGIKPDIAKLLVEKGADINQSSKDGLTPVKAACLAGNTGMVVYLFEKDARINIDDASDEGRELNGTLNHILGDYYLAKDDLKKSRTSFEKAQGYYKIIIDQYQGDVTKIMWQQIGGYTLAAVALPMLMVLNPAAAGTLAANISTGTAVNQQLTAQMDDSIHAYYAHKQKYHHPYVPTYEGVNMSYVPPPLNDAPIAQKKTFAERKAQHFEKRSQIITNVLECFDKNPRGESGLQTCVNTVAKAVAVTQTEKNEPPSKN
jgi:ankyrin repeat protein